MKVTIEKISRKPYTTKDGRETQKVGLLTREHKPKWLGGFEDKVNKHWKVGDSVEVEVSENGEFLNFKMPKNQPIAGLDEINKKLDTIIALITGFQKEEEKIIDYGADNEKPF